MTTTARPRYHVGDTLPALSGTCTRDLLGNGTQTPVDGTSATSTVTLTRQDATTFTRSISVAADGTWSLTLQAGDLTVEGRYTAVVKMTFGGAGPQTFGPSSIDVLP